MIHYAKFYEIISIQNLVYSPNNELPDDLEGNLTVSAALFLNSNLVSTFQLNFVKQNSKNNKKIGNQLGNLCSCH